MSSSAPRSERIIIALVGAVQFINIMDFMMVMPLGPDFSKALGIPTEQLGNIGGSYTLAASVAGVCGAFFLDRFDRRKALGVAMIGLVVGTALGALATDLRSLLLARVVAGLFGGPATSIALSIIIDVVPAERRGRATGAVMGAFSAASVLGVPLGLRLALIGDWRWPFVSTAALGVVVTALALRLLPPMTGHLRARPPAAAREVWGTFLSLLRRREVQLSYAIVALGMSAGFALIPHISPHLQDALHYPREDLDALYFVGGVITFFSMRVAGRAIDRFGALPLNVLGVGGFALVVWLLFVVEVPPLPVLALFAGFMVAQTTRNVAVNTLTSRVPSPAERASFQSLASAVTHAAGGGGAVLSSVVLHHGGMHELALVSIALSAGTPALVWLLERMVMLRAPTSGSAASG